jgi:5-enolpyruvylshikimate-3-phosphate synthase
MHIEARIDSLGQPAADVVVGPGPARGLDIAAERALRTYAGLGVTAAMAARAPRGVRSRLAQLPRLRAEVAASDGAPALCRLISAFGVEAEASERGLELCGVGTERLRPCSIDVAHDPDQELCAILLALWSEGRTVIEGAELPARAPRLLATLRALGVRIDFDSSRAP